MSLKYINNSNRVLLKETNRIQAENQSNNTTDNLIIEKEEKSAEKTTTSSTKRSENQTNTHTVTQSCVKLGGRNQLV